MLICFSSVLWTKDEGEDQSEDGGLTVDNASDDEPGA